MSGFNPRIPGVRSDRSTNCATTTALASIFVHFLVFLSVRVTISVTRWLDYFSIFGHLTRLKSCPKLKNYAKVSSKFCQTLKKPFNICQRFIKFCQSSKISQNLVTLVTIFTWVFLSSKWWEISRNAIPVENIH